MATMLNVIQSVSRFRLQLRHTGLFVALVTGLLAAGPPAQAVTLNPGDILVADFDAQAIIRVDPVTGDQTLVSSGNNFVGPTGIAIEADGNLLVVDQDCCGGSGGLIRVNPATGDQTILSSGVNFSTPLGIAITEAGDVYVVDLDCCGGQGGVIAVDPISGNQLVVASGDNFVHPGAGIAGQLSDGSLVVVDPDCCGGQGGVIAVNPSTGDQVIVSAAMNFSDPFGIAVAANDDLMVVDPSCCGGQGGVIAVNPGTGDQAIVSSGGSFARIAGIAIAANGELLVTGQQVFVGDPPILATPARIVRVDPATGDHTVVSEGGNLASPVGIAVVSGPVLPPGSCGGGVPCACGDRVVLDRTLSSGVDPVTITVCPADGLVVADGVTLDLGGATLRGQHAGAGVHLETGTTNVTVRQGKLIGFGTGLAGEGTTGAHLTNLQLTDNALDGVSLTGNGHTLEKSVLRSNGRYGVTLSGDGNHLSNLQAKLNGGAGVRLVGSGNALQQSVVARNGGPGAEVSGNANQVALLQLESNVGDGLTLVGTGNTASRNTATRNTGDGLEIQGTSATADRNRATSNGEAGLEIHGTTHTVTSNIASLNTGDGLQMRGATASRFDRNRGENNRGFGIADDSLGGGTAGTANTYTLNICGRGNDAGPSSPAGLCR